MSKQLPEQLRNHWGIHEGADPCHEDLDEPCGRYLKFEVAQASCKLQAWI
jgi:hypothetical protein